MEDVYNLLDIVCYQFQPFNGTNSHSVVVMDNASVYHYEEVADIIGSIILLKLH